MLDDETCNNYQIEKIALGLPTKINKEGAFTVELTIRKDEVDLLKKCVHSISKFIPFLNSVDN